MDRLYTSISIARWLLEKKRTVVLTDEPHWNSRQVEKYERPRRSKRNYILLGGREKRYGQNKVRAYGQNKVKWLEKCFDAINNATIIRRHTRRRQKNLRCTNFTISPRAERTLLIRKLVRILAKQNHQNGR